MRPHAVMPCLGAAALLLFAVPPSPGATRPQPPVVGRWDLAFHAPDSDYPSWLEVTESGGKLAGRFVGRTGSVFPVRSVEFTGDTLAVTLPGRRQEERRLEARLEGDHLAGKAPGRQGASISWEGRRAPDLRRSSPPEWGQPAPLFNGRDLEGWRARDAKQPNGWKAEDGRLVNAKPGNDLVTQATFNDFQLHAEFRYPKESNSG